MANRAAVSARVTNKLCHALCDCIIADSGCAAGRSGLSPLLGDYVPMSPCSGTGVFRLVLRSGPIRGGIVARSRPTRAQSPSGQQRNRCQR